MKLLFPTELSHGNLMFDKAFPMIGGVLPKEHPFWDNPEPLTFPGKAFKASDDRLSNFRRAGYFASCFPEGDGIVFSTLKGQDNEQIKRDIIEYLKVELDSIYKTETIKMVSFWQPFATLMFYGKVETRKWPTSYRGLVLICTTQKPLVKQPSEKITPVKFNGQNRLDIALAKSAEMRMPIPTFDLNGYAIGIGRLVECRKVMITDNTYYDHDLTVYAHVYEEVQRIKPFEIKGFQGMYRNIPEEARTKIELL